MSAMPDPTRPDEVPHQMTRIELAEAISRHAEALTSHQCGVTVVPDAELAGHCLAELAYSAELAERILLRRWVVAVEALGTGETPERVATAMHLTPDELYSGLRRWVAQRRRLGLIGAERHAEVLALIGDLDHTGGESR